MLMAAVSVTVLVAAVGLERSGRFEHALALDDGLSAVLAGDLQAGADDLPSPPADRPTRGERPGDGDDDDGDGDGDDDGESGDAGDVTHPDGGGGADDAPIEVPRQGSGEMDIVAGTVPRAGPGETFTYRVEVERGLPFEGEVVAETIHSTLIDDRGWQGIKGVSFERVDGEAPIRVILASPATTDELCAPLETQGEVSCRQGNRVVLNAKRWAVGVPHFDGDLETYREYLVNHEVGHALGEGHVECPSPGAPAPVMMQQTKGLDECEPNPWPSVGTSS